MVSLRGNPNALKQSKSAGTGIGAPHESQIKRGSCGRAHKGHLIILVEYVSYRVRSFPRPNPPQPTTSRRPSALNAVRYTTNDSPHPQLRFTFGLTSLKPADISSSE